MRNGSFQRLDADRGDRSRSLFVRFRCSGTWVTFPLNSKHTYRYWLRFPGRPHEARVTALMLLMLQHEPYEEFVDVGCHFGWYSCWAGVVSPHTSIRAFDVLPMSIAATRQALRLNSVKGAWVRRLAVMDVATGYEYGYPRGILPANTTVQHSHLCPVGHVVGTSLDEALGHGPGRLMVKVDVEGAEGHVVRGMKQLLRRRRPVVYIEVHEQLLRDRGHDCATILTAFWKEDYLVWKIPRFRSARSRVSPSPVRSAAEVERQVMLIAVPIEGRSIEEELGNIGGTRWSSHFATSDAGAELGQRVYEPVGDPPAMVRAVGP